MTKTALYVLTSALLMQGCANTGASYTPLVDGPRNSSFVADLSACQAVAAKRGYLNDDTKSDVLLGAALGALLGAVDGDDAGSAIGGALFGGATGAAAGAYDTKDQRKEIVISCMRGRGHRVVG